MRKKIVTTFLILLGLFIIVFVYVSFFSDYAMPGQGCGTKFTILPHGNKTCVFPFSCKSLGEGIVGGVCSL